MEELQRNAHTAAERGDTIAVYKTNITRTGNKHSEATIGMGNSGNMLTKEYEQLNIWAEHFQEI